MCDIIAIVEEGGIMRVVNSLLLKDDKILFLFKQSRQKWFLPGGKAEFSENVIQTGIREFFEESGLHLQHVSLGAVTTVVVEEAEGQKEWMLYTIKGTDADGSLQEVNREGILKWHDVGELDHLPMFEGDRFIIKQLVHKSKYKTVSIRWVHRDELNASTYELIKVISSYDVEDKEVLS